MKVVIMSKASFPTKSLADIPEGTLFIARVGMLGDIDPLNHVFFKAYDEEVYMIDPPDHIDYRVRIYKGTQVLFHEYQEVKTLAVDV